MLSGGDPLVRPDALELIEHGVGLGLQMTLTPSGTASLTPDRIADLADAGLRRLALSTDGGTAATHDEFRGEPGSFDQTMAAARTAREAGLPLQINTTVCRETVEDLPAVRDLVGELGAVLWSVFFLVPVGRGRALDPISPQRAEAVVDWLLDVRDEGPFGVKTTEAPHYRRVALQRRQDDGGTGGDAGSPGDGHEHARGGPPDGIGRRTGVTAGDGFAFVSHVGDVYPSGFLPASTGNVREANIVDIYREADLFERLRDPDALTGKCGACEFRRVCGGSRSRAYAYTGDPLASDPLCAYVPPAFDGERPEQSLSD